VDCSTTTIARQRDATQYFNHTGKRPGRIRDEDLAPPPVGRPQPGPQGRRRGALLAEVPDEDTGDLRGAGPVEQQGALQEQVDGIGRGMLCGDGEGHRGDVVGSHPGRARGEGRDAGHPAPTAQVQDRLPTGPRSGAGTLLCPAHLPGSPSALATESCIERNFREPSPTRHWERSAWRASALVGFSAANSLQRLMR